MSTSSMCGIVLANGRDCPSPVAPDAPLNLCDEHFAQAAVWHQRTAAASAETIRAITTCPVCQRTTLHAGHCVFCGHRTADATAALPLNDAELEIVRSRMPRPRRT